MRFYMVGDNLDVLRPDDIETAIVVGDFQGARLSECDFVTQSDHAGESVGDIHVFLGEVNSGHLTLMLCGQVTCGTPEATSDVQYARTWLE
jgi:hypothetical protein